MVFLKSFMDKRLRDGSLSPSQERPRNADDKESSGTMTNTGQSGGQLAGCDRQLQQRGPGGGGMSAAPGAWLGTVFEEGESIRIDMAITEFRMIEDMVAVFAERYLSMPLEVGGCSYCPLPLVCTTRAQHGHEAPAPCLFKVDCPQVEATLRSEGLLDW